MGSATGLHMGAIYEVVQIGPIWVWQICIIAVHQRGCDLRACSQGSHAQKPCTKKQMIRYAILEEAAVPIAPESPRSFCSIEPGQYWNYTLVSCIVWSCSGVCHRPLLNWHCEQVRNIYY